MSGITGMVPFRPNLFGGYLPPEKDTPYRPGVFQGYIVKPWYLDTKENTDDTVTDSTGSETEESVEGSITE